MSWRRVLGESEGKDLGIDLFVRDCSLLNGLGCFSCVQFFFYEIHSLIYSIHAQGMGPCSGWALGRRTRRHGPGPALLMQADCPT